MRDYLNIVLCVQIDCIKVDEHIQERTSVLSGITMINSFLLDASLDQTKMISEKISTIIGEEEDLQDELDALSILDVSTSVKPTSRKSVTSSLVVCTSDSDISTTAKSMPSSLEVIAPDSIGDESSDTDLFSSGTSIAEPKQKRKLPEEWVVLLQKGPSPSHDVRGAWYNTSVDAYKHLKTEYNYRINKNLAYLSESWRLQKNAQKWRNLKVLVPYVKTFENEWLDSSSQESPGKRDSSPLSEIQKEISHVITVLKSQCAK